MISPGDGVGVGVLPLAPEPLSPVVCRQSLPPGWGESQEAELCGGDSIGPESEKRGNLSQLEH